MTPGRRPPPVPATTSRSGPRHRRETAITAGLVGLLVLLGGAAGIMAHVSGDPSPQDATPATVTAATEGPGDGAPDTSRGATASEVAGGDAAVPGAAAPDVADAAPAQGAREPTVAPPGPAPQDLAAGVLALEVPASASGVLDVVPGAQAAPGPGPARPVRVEVERGLPVDQAAFAATVMTTLNDPRGWGARGGVSFARTDGPADIRVVLASPALVDALCAPLPTRGETSCGRNGHAALNLRRWVHATEEFTDRTQYRQYLVNHEVGHLLGQPHETCPEAGALAPIMQQQTLGVAPCLPNAWPYPQG